MPALWDDAELSAGIEAAGLVAVLTEGRRGARRPAEDLTRAAMRHFGLRYLAPGWACATAPWQAMDRELIDWSRLENR